MLALSATGLGVAVYMIVEPAPDVALVQIVVDILATVILVLAIGRLPLRLRETAQNCEQASMAHTADSRYWWLSRYMDQL